MIHNTILEEYTIKGLDFLIFKTNTTSEISQYNLAEAENLGKEEVDFRWRFSKLTNNPYIIHITEKLCGYYLNNLSITEKYAFRKGILMKMLELATPLNELNDMYFKGYESAIFIDYSFYGNGVFLFEAPITTILEIAKTHLTTLNMDLPPNLSNESLFLLNAHVPIPFHKYTDLRKYRYIYLPYEDIA